MNVDDLESFRRALDDLEALPPLEQARVLPELIKAAQPVLARRRAAVFAELVADGWTIVALAKELDIKSRSKIDDALAAHRAATSAKS